MLGQREIENEPIFNQQSFHFKNKKKTIKNFFENSTNMTTLHRNFKKETVKIFTDDRYIDDEKQEKTSWTEVSFFFFFFFWNF